MAHWEMIGTAIFRRMQGASCAELEAAGSLGCYTMHNHGVFPTDPNGVSYIQATSAAAKAK